MYTKLSITAVLLFSLAFLNVGCNKKSMDMPQSDSAPAVQETSSAADTVSDYIPSQGNYTTVTQCPVTKEKVVVGKDTKAAKYKDKIYYFCCPSCIQQFKANPEKYK